LVLPPDLQRYPEQEDRIANLYNKARVGNWLTLYGIASLVWLSLYLVSQLGWSINLDSRTGVRLTLYGLLGLTIFFVLLSRSFLQKHGIGYGWYFLGLLWAGGYSLLENGLLQPASTQPVPESVVAPGVAWLSNPNSLSLTVLLLGWSIFIIGATLTLASTQRKAHQPLSRKRCKYWAWVLILVASGDSLILAGLAFHLPHPEFGITVGFTLHFLAYAVALYATRNLFLRKARYDPALTLREYSLSISNVTNSQALAKTTFEVIGQVLEVKSGYLAQVEKEQSEGGEPQYRLHILGSAREIESIDGILTQDSPLAAYFTRESHPITQLEIAHSPRFMSLSQQEREWFAGSEIEVFVPIHTHQDWIGLLAIGSKVSGVPFYDEDLEFLSVLAAQASVALQTLHLVDSLARLNNDFRRAFAAMERANRHLERLDRTKSDFISIVSHELRTPISVIRGYSEILADEELIKANPYYEKMVGGIRANILRLNEMVDGMLDMASIDTKALQLAIEPVSLSNLLKMIIENARKHTLDRKLDLRLEDLHDLPPVEADPEALQKVFTHLIYNAIKFTPDGGNISVLGHSLPPDTNGLPEGGVEVIVKDTGIGIARDYQDLIFNKFYRTEKVNLHSSGKTKFKGGGQGLGLSIAKGIVEAHGGKIWVESPGYDEKRCPGSQFHVVLPMDAKNDIIKSQTVLWGLPRPPGDGFEKEENTS
jgi:signal transduction histidine kinase